MEPFSLMPPMRKPASRDAALLACAAAGTKPPDDDPCLLLTPRVVRELLHKLLALRTSTLDAMRCRLRICMQEQVAQGDVGW